MSVQSVLKNLDVTVSPAQLKRMKQETKEFVALLKTELSHQHLDADVFVGGSFAKGTLVKSHDYDADIFVRFDWAYEDLSAYLETVMKRIAQTLKYPVTKMHGSRDYFRVEKDELTFEVIPVLRIKKVREARNVTDLSYFHVRYLKKKMNAKLQREIALAKKFCKAQRVYGAESYISGFSGYGLECLLIHYKTFAHMLRKLSSVTERIVIDPARQYRNRASIYVEMNESKLHSPIVLVDPTWKERNVLAALSHDTFERFKAAAKEFLAHPSEEFFISKPFDLDTPQKYARKKRSQFLAFDLSTTKQEGDIGGTKMKKFYRHLLTELVPYFDVLDSDFYYSGEGHTSNAYVVARPKKEVVRIGPPMEMKKEVVQFKKAHLKTFTKNGFVHARVSFERDVKKFVQKYLRTYKDVVKGMSIDSVSYPKI